VVFTDYAMVSTLKFVYTLMESHHFKMLISSCICTEVGVRTIEILIMMFIPFYSFNAGIIRRIDIGIALISIGILHEDL
jgi:hypothetical protein